MAATAAATSSCKTTTTFFPPSAPKPPLTRPHNFNPSPKQSYLYSHRCSNPSLGVKHPQISSFCSITPRSVSSPETAVVEDQAEQSGAPPDDDVSLGPASLSPLTGCKACGREDIESGCNGEGRIQGGIATVPGFGWWPIKAYRPCPAYVASGGRYRRSGQSMDEVVSGGAKSSKKKEVPKRLKS